MSLWILQSDGHADQPLSFERLAEMLADQIVHEWDQVRLADSSEWQSIDSVIGLCRAAGRLRAERALPNADPPIEAGQQSAKLTKSADASLLFDAEAVPGKQKSVSGKWRNDEAAAVTSRGSAMNGAASKPHAISPVWTMFVCLGLAVVGWLAWSMWYESRRFPLPAHLQKPSQPWILPILGPVSGLEISFLAFDSVAVLVFLVWRWRELRRHRK